MMFSRGRKAFSKGGRGAQIISQNCRQRSKGGSRKKLAKRRIKGPSNQQNNAYTPIGDSFREVSIDEQRN